MAQYLIRLAVGSEQKALEELQMRAALSNEGDRDAMLAHPDAIELPLEQIDAGQVFVLESDGEVLGFAAILPRPDGDTELDALFVEPNARRRGVGRELVDYCSAVARANGSSALHVIGNPHAEDFYRASGFEQIGTFETRFGIGLLMKRAL